jgi:hypothetical protein
MVGIRNYIVERKAFLKVVSMSFKLYKDMVFVKAKFIDIFLRKQLQRPYFLLCLTLL